MSWSSDHPPTFTSMRSLSRDAASVAEIAYFALNLVKFIVEYTFRHTFNDIVATFVYRRTESGKRLTRMERMDMQGAKTDDRILCSKAM